MIPALGGSSERWAAARRQAFRERRTVVDALPYLSNIEPTSRCNAKCRYCPRPDRPRDLAAETFARLMDEPFVDLANPWMHFRGEPLLYRDLPELVRAVAERGGARLSTNGLLMTETWARRLVEAGLTQIVFSVDAVLPETYRRLRGSDSLATVRRGVDIFAAVRRGTRAHLQVQMVASPSNRLERRAFLDFWCQADVDSIHFKPLYSRAGALDLTEAEQAPLRTARGSFPCFLPWSTLVVRADGSIGVCCSDFTDALTLGILDDVSLAEAWNGPRMTALRVDHIAGCPPAACRNCLEVVDETGIPGNPPLFLSAAEAEGHPLPEDRSIFVLIG